MLSTVVLVLDRGARRGGISPEVVARSLSWLVSAAVVGLVRDVVLACPPSIDLSNFADQAGCGFVQGATERDRIKAALDRLRGDDILILVAGNGGDTSVIEDLETVLAHSPDRYAFRILGTPPRGLRRLLSIRSPIVGLAAPRASLLSGSIDTFATMAKRQRGAKTLTTRMHPLS